MPQLAFQGVTPLRMIGVNGVVPFCSIISEGKLIYSSGNSIVLENTRNKQQKILYTHPHSSSIQLITHHVTLYNQHLLAIATKQENIQMNAITIVPLNAALFHLQERKEVVQTHYLKNIEEYQIIEAVTFFQEGSLLGIISVDQNQTTFSLLRTSNGDLLFQQSHTSTEVKMRAANLNKQSCISLLLQDKKEGSRLCLMAVDELSRRYFYNLKLSQKELILEYAFQTFQEEALYLMALTTEGCILIFKINEYQADLTVRIDVRINVGNFQDALEWMDTMPNQIEAAGNKIVIAYQQSKVLALLQFSSFNPNSYKLIILSETLQKYSNIRATHSIRVSKDACTLAGLFLINNEPNTTASMPYTTRTVPLIPEERSISKERIAEITTMRNLDIKPQQQFIALQIDLLSNQIENTDKQSTVEQTLSVCAGHALVQKIEYCPHNNTMFILLHNKALKYYNLSPRFGPRGKLDFQIQDLLLWTNSFIEQPISITAHPFNFSIVLIYADIIKFHNYNSKRIFPAFIVTSIQNCRLASYSPLGDKLVLATQGSLIVIDSYTFRTIRVLTLPNLVMSPLATNVASTSRQVGAKNINSMHFLSNDEIFLLSGHNTLSIVLNFQKTVHFGLFEGDGECKQTVVFDKINNLAIVAVKDVILVLSKSFNNTSNKCSLISKFEISASSLLQVSKLGVFFIGTDDGTLIMLSWPQYAQQDLYSRQSSKLHLFNEPIISIKVTPSMRFLYAISLSGSIAICQLQVGDTDSVSSQYKRLLIKLSEIPLRQMNCWLMSQYQEQRKQRDIIKLRGEEADNTNQHANIGKECFSTQQKLIKSKKVELEDAYLTEIKNYQERLGIQKLLHSITMLRDELKMITKQRDRNLNELHEVEINQLNLIFKQRNTLQNQLDDLRKKCEHQKRKLQRKLNKEQVFLEQDFLVQTNLIKQKTEEVHLDQQQKFKELQMKSGQAEFEKDETLQILRGEFQIDYCIQKEAGQAVLSRNRSTNIAIHSLQSKMSELSVQKQNLQYDLIKVSQQKEQLQNTQEELESILSKQQGAYDRLIRRSRQLETDLIQQRRLATKNQFKLSQMMEQIQSLEKKEGNLTDTYQKMNTEFIQLKQQHHNTSVLVQQNMVYFNSLKEIKKNKYYQKCLGKTRCANAFRNLARQLEVDEGETIQQLKSTLQDRQQQIQENELGRQFVQRQSTNDKLTLDALRWRQIKQCYLVGYRRSYHKLKGQNIKLTYQYNDLIKVQQQYKTYIIYLLERIKASQKLKENQEISNFNVKSKTKHNDAIMTPHILPQKQLKQTAIRKKAVCLSLHQQTGKFITEV